MAEIKLIGVEFFYNFAEGEACLFLHQLMSRKAVLCNLYHGREADIL